MFSEIELFIHVGSHSALKAGVNPRDHKKSKAKAPTVLTFAIEIRYSDGK